MLYINACHSIGLSVHQQGERGSARTGPGSRRVTSRERSTKGHEFPHHQVQVCSADSSGFCSSGAGRYRTRLWISCQDIDVIAWARLVPLVPLVPLVTCAGLGHSLSQKRACRCARRPMLLLATASQSSPRQHLRPDRRASRSLEVPVASHEAAEVLSSAVGELEHEQVEGRLHALLE